MLPKLLRGGKLIIRQAVLAILSHAGEKNGSKDRS